VEIPSAGQPVAINDRSEVLVGACCTGPLEIWRQGKVRRLHASVDSGMSGLNELSWAAGLDLTAGRGLIWLPTGAAAKLPRTPGDLGSVASAINDRGQVAGVSRLSSRNSDGTHAVIWQISPLLHIETPNTDSRWGVNTVQRLAWTYLGSAPEMRIEISRDSGKTWQELTTVANSPGSSQSFYWRVTAPLTSAARFRVSAIGDPAATDVNDTNVRIAAPTVEILRPTDTTTVAYGSRLTIAYRHSLGARAPIAIDASQNNGESWRTVATTETNGSTTGTFTWTVDLTPTTRARVRIRALDGVDAKSTSRAFVVTAAAPGVVSSDDSQ
jgi:hypothetical protein